MKRSVLWSIGSLTLLMSAVAHTDARRAPNRVILDAHGNVSSFYGVPVKLTRSGLKHLPFRVKRGHKSSEGIEYTTHTITAQNGVRVEVTFDDDGRLYAADTRSPNAVGPKGIGVGSTLAEVEQAWPEGAFIFGSAEGEYVTFVTGTNLLFRFDPREMPPGAFNPGRPANFPVPGNIKIQTISLFRSPIPVAESAEPIDLDKTWTTVGHGASKLEVERIPGTTSVRLTWSDKGKTKIDQIVDVSAYDDLDIWGHDLIYYSGPLVVSFRYGNFEDCDAIDDDRDKVYVTFDGKQAIMSLHSPEGIKVVETQPMPKYLGGGAIDSVIHGCRLKFDPKTGTARLGKAS